MDILNYALAKKIFGKGTSGGGGESGVPLKVTKLPEASSKSVGKVYFVDQKATPKVGDVLGDKLYFDTTKNPMDYFSNTDKDYITMLEVDIDESDSQVDLTIGANVQTIDDGYLCILAGTYTNGGAILLYINSNVLTVEQYNQEAAGQGMPAVTEFGWQVDEMDISPVTGATISYAGEGAEVVQMDGGSAYYLGTSEKNTFTIGTALGSKIHFDTTINPADFGIPPGEMAPVVTAQSDSTSFGILVGELLGGGDQGTCYMVVCGDILSNDPSSVDIVYAECDVLTVDQFNEMMGSQFGFTITKFGWQTDVLDTSAYADCIVQENYLYILGNLAYAGTEYLFDTVNEQLFEGTIANLQSEKDVLQEQYNEVNSVATVLQNSATELYIPDDTTLEEGVLGGCNSLKKMSLPTVILPPNTDRFFRVFGSTTNAIPSSFETVIIRGGEIPENAFRDTTGIKNVVIEDGVTAINNNAFSQCGDLQNVVIGNGVADIGITAFYNCDSLTDVIVGDSVVNIPTSAFNSCDNLTNITLGAKVESIDSRAFSYCKKLTSLPLNNNIKSIGEDAFKECTSITNIFIPANVSSIGVGAFDDNNAESIEVDENNTVYHSKDNCLIETSTNKLITGCKNSIIPEYVTSIGPYAFEGVDIESIEIPDTVTSLGVRAFGYCEKLKSIKLPNNITVIPNSLLPGSGITSIEIPDKVTDIGESAFFNCQSLTTINIPVSVTKIRKHFIQATNNLRRINYAGTVEQWQAIDFGYRWDHESGNYWSIYCTDGEISKYGSVTYY